MTQVTFWAFECLPACSLPELHSKLFILFIASGIIHYVTAIYLTRSSSQWMPQAIVLLAAAVAFVVLICQFIWAGSEYRACTVKPSDPQCKATLATPHKPWFYEVLAVLVQSATTPALITCAAWQRYTDQPLHEYPQLVFGDSMASASKDG